MTKRMNPCIDCGGQKERGKQGSRKCGSCLANPKSIKVIDKDILRERSAKYRLKIGIQPKKNKINENGFVWCLTCNDYLHPDFFGKRKIDSQKEGHRFTAYCTKHGKEYNQRQRLHNVYGISTKEYNEMLDFQDHLCFICHRSDHSYRFAVDHNHETGEIRGLLCNKCNSGILGWLQDDIEAIKRAISYLETPPAFVVQNISSIFCPNDDGSYRKVPQRKKDLVHSE